jgi:hypothetical protein
MQRCDGWCSPSVFNGEASLVSPWWWGWGLCRCTLVAPRWRLELCRVSSGRGVAEAAGSVLLSRSCACNMHGVVSGESLH